jgi:hypothetical protein
MGEPSGHNPVAQAHSSVHMHRCEGCGKPTHNVGRNGRCELCAAYLRGYIQGRKELAYELVGFARDMHATELATQTQCGD